jgi:hypothetical protein
MPVTPVTDWGQAMMTSIAAALAMFLGAIPKVIGFAVILIVGWIIASLIAPCCCTTSSREVQRSAQRSGLVRSWKTGIHRRGRALATIEVVRPGSSSWSPPLTPSGCPRFTGAAAASAVDSNPVVALVVLVLAARGNAVHGLFVARLRKRDWATPICSPTRAWRHLGVRHRDRRESARHRDDAGHTLFMVTVGAVPRSACLSWAAWTAA